MLRQHRESKRGGKRGFTLIELIIVIVVLGILAGIAIAGYTAVIRRSNISSVEQSAVSFNRQLAAMASQRAESGFQTGTEFDKSTRIGDILVEAALAGDCPRGVTVSTIGVAADGTTLSRVDVCDASGAASGLAAVGSNSVTEVHSGVAPAVVRYPAYMQFVKNGAGVCLRLSDTGLRADNNANTATGSVSTPSDGTTGAGWIIMKKVANGAQTSVNAANPCNGVPSLGYPVADPARFGLGSNPTNGDWDTGVVLAAMNAVTVMQGW